MNNNIITKHNKFDENTNSQNNSTLISANTRIEGNIISKSELRILGIIVGDLTAKRIYLEKEALCTGMIKSELIVISGKFNGNITTKHIEVKSTAKIRGKIEQSTISVDKSAQIDAIVKINV